jgi:hypothetical protein
VACRPRDPGLAHLAKERRDFVIDKVQPISSGKSRKLVLDVDDFVGRRPKEVTPVMLCFSSRIHAYIHGSPINSTTSFPSDMLDFGG